MQHLTKSVLIVDNNRISSHTIYDLLKNESAFSVHSPVYTAKDALAALKSHVFDLVIIDNNLHDFNIFILIRLARRINSKAKFIVIVTDDTPYVLKNIINMGIDGIINKFGKIDTIRTIAKLVMSGYNCFPGTARVTTETKLTERELQILNYIYKGMSNKEIGEKLFISPKTVSVHRHNILSKMGAKNTFDLIRSNTSNSPHEESS
ncbi:response regulator transcription factor [Enterobacter sp. CC120223-11]|uniref:response regulator transcription factor n=1 Tax=Enterobacter sp. CC120223-11 TaxID=1378073 RepID=UPI000BD38AB0|nr:response regulator transcription factor [Enterobacter sp. CC120223-11]SNY65374.1 two component transcriptional regulator, LuxR family [Enterobacter sp. CC120223-11]